MDADQVDLHPTAVALEAGPAHAVAPETGPAYAVAPEVVALDAVGLETGPAYAVAPEAAPVEGVPAPTPPAPQLGIEGQSALAQRRASAGSIANAAAPANTPTPNTPIVPVPSASISSAPRPGAPTPAEPGPTAMPTVPTVPTWTPSSAGLPPTGPVPTAKPAGRERPGVLVALSILLVLALAGGGLFYVHGRHAATSNPQAGSRAGASAPAAATSSIQAGLVIATAEPVDGGVLYKSSVGHFQARFPDTPVAASAMVNVGGDSLAEYLAVDATSSSVVMAAYSKQPVPDDEVQSTMDSFIAGLEHTSNATTESVTPTTLDGHAAFQAELDSASGQSFEVAYSLFTDHWLYAVMAAPGPVFTMLQTSFSANP